ncbi:MAG: S41 family peptidase [Crocinitomicaceae bacterium]|nr:S41 family peptidase [Crocinitomicaceae bacterium]
MKLRILAVVPMLIVAGRISAQIENPEATTEKFASLLNYIEHMYVDSVNAEKLTEKAIIAMLEDLDPHSVYLSKEELKEANEPLQGSFDGVGIQFNILHDTIYVVEPIQGGPSERLGIRSGDKIVEIEEKVVAGIGIKNSDIISKLRGPRGTKVKVGIQRKGDKEIAHYEITRDKIPIYSIDATYMVAPTVGYIKVSRFARTTTDELQKGIAKLKKQGMKDLILDLQGNGGGLLTSAIEMGDEFISGDKLLVYTQGRAFPKEEFRAKKNVIGSFEKGRLVVLVDESSASASEIVSGAIQDWDRGLIIGRRSFGKGLVQRPIPLPDGSAVRLTVQKYYTPSGRCIQKSYNDGVDEYYKDSKKRYDHGEFFSVDSIKMPDSLKYYTNVKKRIVYGGGGIMPDIFVPFDTTENSEYFYDLRRTGVNSDWALTYSDANREKLLKQFPDLTKFIAEFQIPESGLDELIGMAEEKEVPFNEEQYNTSKHAIKIQLKALIARSLYDNESFYRVINDLNPSLKTAVEVLKNGTFDKKNLAYSEFLDKESRRP